jgi:broad specificity phosphatase PhoE
MTTIFLARHGRSKANEARTVAGQLDVALSPDGHRQAEALAQLLSQYSIDAVYASSLRRAIDTAQPAASLHRLTVQTIEAFREIHFGSLEGRNRDTDPEVREAYERWRAAPDVVVPPGGESYADLVNRVSPALATLAAKHRGETILIVGHQVTNRAILGELASSAVLGPDIAKAKLNSRNIYEICLGEHSTIRTLTIREGFIPSSRDGFHV